MSRAALLALLALLGSMSWFAFGTTDAIAAAPAPDGCQKIHGTILCATSDPVGNSESSGGNSQTRDTSSTSQGNTTNKFQSCTTGPGNQTTCP
jgi:hypothetical protein